MAEETKTGTTTLAMVCTDGVVAGTERRATMGTMIAHKVTKKMFKIDDNLCLTTAGLVGDAQTLVRWLTVEASLYKMRKGSPMTVKAASTLMANILSGNRYFPYWVQLLICGVDLEGSHVYSLDAAGGAIPDKYVVTGSGSPYAYGVLEDQYKDDITASDGVDLAVRALTMAMRRDAACGDGIDIAVITKKGYKELTDEEIKKRKEKMGLS
ncbi:MAG: archaeal proteasome endopeptidase complex subunit beta [Thermoplasmatales archaeon]|nr:archaeal proteasome endopeptidase complex subunit beta [Thermoplasmatales archaeon]